MVRTRVMRALTSAFLVLMLASIAGGFLTTGVAQTEIGSGAACGVDYASMLKVAVNSAMYTLIELNVSTDSASWSLVMEANASVEAVAQAQAAGQCTTALQIYLNATKKIAEAISIAKKEAAESAAVMEAQAKLVTEVRAEIKAAIDLRSEIRSALEAGRINGSLEAQLEARVNASIQALVQLEARINASIEAGNLTAQAIQEFRAELKQIKADIKAVSKELDEAVAESHKAEISARVEAKLREAIKALMKTQAELQARGVCEDLPDICLAINQSIEQLMNLTIALNQSINANMSAVAAMVAAAHADMAAKGLLEAVVNVSAEVNASIELHNAYINASAKLDELKQAMIDLRNEMAARLMPTQQIEMLIHQVDQIKEEIHTSVRHAHKHRIGGDLVSDTSAFFRAVADYMAQLNQSMGMDSRIRAKIEAVMTALTQAEVAVNATIEISANVSATFNETCENKARALLEKSIKVAVSAEKTFKALGMEAEASAVAQAITKLEAAINAVESGDNTTAIQEIDAAIQILSTINVSSSGSHAAVSASIKVSISIELATTAKAELQ